jgi:hypothetical protein
MSLSNAVSNKPLSKRQRRMLQDMGIDVFTTRQVASPELHDENPTGSETGKETGKETGNEVLPSASEVSPLAAARTALVTDAETPPDIPPNIPEAGEPSQDVAESSSVSTVRIELNVVATSSMVHLGEVPLSAQELRFLQDLASALHWMRTRSALNDKLRNTEFRWPIVEAAGTPERAVAVFCQKHQMLSGETPVLITPAAQAALSPWISAETSHWIVVETLSDVSSQGVAKRALWQQVMQCLGASKSTKRSVTDSP